ncbi:hypothetical protein G5V58_14585 [Nocardioides anomalus]|uniref:ATP synthase subunit I n=1 Tax=Nocardioides anomalus TaxID=2712223 RepID=A0A6G6WF17_9ACTN|nr:hypothetical protein [Nocardioides anomalus]QIG43832.1 hypothetical protein G5V58_14585 [Nocardioides anomalus]
MTEQRLEQEPQQDQDLAQPQAASDAPAPALPQGRATVGRVLRDQRKTIAVALCLAVASYWIIGQLGEWRLAGALAIGVALGLLNHLATEFWLLRIITNGSNPSRGQMIRSTISRLALLSVVAVGAAVLMWPDGIGVLLGLAVFRLIALMMTSLTLLKELKSDDPA